MARSSLTIAGREVPRVGIGTMQLTGPDAMGEPADPAEARAVLRRAVDAGVRLVDTSGYYGPGVANRIVAEALHPYPPDLLIATKVGARRTPDGGFCAAATPSAVRAAVHDNLRQLRVEALPLVHARYMPDATVPFDETVGILAELRDAGVVEHVGVSNVTADQLAAAREVVPIASVENELSLGRRADAVLEAATSAGVPFVAFRPLGNGALLRPPSPLVRLAEHAGLPAATLAVAWVLARHRGVVAIPGTSSVAHLEDLLEALELRLAEDLLSELNGLEAS